MTSYLNRSSPSHTPWMVRGSLQRGQTNRSSSGHLNTREFSSTRKSFNIKWFSIDLWIFLWPFIIRHNESVKCIQFNPLTGQLASCTSTDFGIWSPEHKSVTKHKISSAINACSWSADGHYLALATASGYISLRTKVWTLTTIDELQIFISSPQLSIYMMYMYPAEWWGEK